MATGRGGEVRVRARSAASFCALGIAVALAVLAAPTAEAAECFKSFGTRKAFGSDWKVSALQSILRSDRGGRCAVVGLQFDYALVAPHRAKELIVADVVNGEMYRLKLDPFGLAWEGWVGFSRADLLALDPLRGFRLGYYANGLGSDRVEVSSSIDDFLSAQGSLIDFQWGIRARR